MLNERPDPPLAALLEHPAFVGEQRAAPASVKLEPEDREQQQADDERAVQRDRRPLGRLGGDALLSRGGGEGVPVERLDEGREQGLRRGHSLLNARQAAGGRDEAHAGAVEPARVIEQHFGARTVIGPPQLLDRRRHLAPQSHRLGDERPGTDDTIAARKGLREPLPHEVLELEGVRPNPLDEHAHFLMVPLVAAGCLGDEDHRGDDGDRGEDRQGLPPGPAHAREVRRQTGPHGQDDRLLGDETEKIGRILENLSPTRKMWRLREW